MKELKAKGFDKDGKMECGCEHGVKHCDEAARLLKGFDMAEGSETRAKAAEAYNKHFGYDTE